MRITSGSFKGKHLQVPKQGVAPTSEMLRQAIISILRPRLRDARMIDLCCGTGAVGIEALSNGAGWCLFVENSSKVYRFLHQNLEEIVADSTRYHCLMHNAAELSPDLLEESPASYDIVFADPFYHDTKDLLDKIYQFASQILRKDGILVLEHGQELDLSAYPAYTRTRKYGDSWISTFENWEVKL